MLPFMMRFYAVSCCCCAAAAAAAAAAFSAARAAANAAQQLLWPHGPRQFLRAQAVSLVVVGARADPDLAGLGSTASKVVRSPSHPVLIVRPGSAEPATRVLTAVDLREGSVHALGFALALYPAAHHRLLYALAPALDPTAPDDAAGQSPSGNESRLARAEHDIQALLLTLAGRTRHPLAADVADDVPERAILVAAGAWPADCVVVGHRGERSAHDSIPGNMAQHVMQYTLVDVLVVP